MSERQRCKRMVPSPGLFMHRHQCTRYAVGDHGYCKIHSPEGEEQRREATLKRQEKAMKETPWYRLGVALRKIARLEAKIRKYEKRFGKL